MATLRRPDFSTAFNFVVAKPLLVGSNKFEPDPTMLFDKGLVTTRLLRQLYEAKYLEVAPEGLGQVVEQNAQRIRRRRFSDGRTA